MRNFEGDVMMNKKISVLMLIFGVLLCQVFLAVPYAGAAEIQSEDFEDTKHEIGKPPYNNKFTLAQAGGGTVTVQVDPATGSKALRIVVPKTEENACTSSLNKKTGFIYSFPKQTTGYIEVSFDFRAENHSVTLPDFYIGDGVGNGISKISQWQDNYYNQTQTGALLFQNTEDVVSLRYVFDIANYKFDLYIGDAKEPVIKDCPYFGNSKRDNIGRIVVRGAYDLVNGTNGSWNGRAEGDGVYWIDNIVIKSASQSIVNAAPAEQEDVSLSEIPAFTFAYPVDTDKFSKQNLELTKNGVALTKDQFSYSFSDENKILQIAVDGGLDYNCAYTIQVKGPVSAIGQGLQDFTGVRALTFTTEKLMADIENLKDNGRYFGITPTKPEAPGCVLAATLSKDGGAAEPFSFGTAVSELGSYILTVTASKGDGSKSETRAYHFSVIESIPPDITDIKLTADGNTAGSKLTAAYNFEDIGGGSDDSVFSWWKSTTGKDDDFHKIANAQDKEYILQDGDEGVYIKFGVLPRSGDRVGETELFSPVFITRMKPVAADVSISGKAILGSAVRAEYRYIDLNDATGSSENGTKFQWYRKDGDTLSSLGTEREYVITEADKDCLLYVEVTPGKGDFPFYYGEPSRSQSKFWGPVAPYVDNLTILGSASVGQTLAAVYDLHDENDPAEGNGICRWYCGTELLREGSSIELTEDMAGKKIHYEVTPVSDVFPYEGEVAASNSVTVSAKISNRGGAGLSSGRGGSARPVVTPAQPEPGEKKDPHSAAFSDINLHWASDVIEKMAERNMIQGTEDGRFLPDHAITRGEVSKVISALLKLRQGEKQTEFNDVPKEAWYAPYISSVASNGIMSGDGENFRPADCITREELCVVMSNIIKKYDIEYTLQSKVFQDASDISAWAADAVAIASSLKLVNGRTETSFFPRENVTRAEAVVMIERLCSVIGEGKQNEK